MISLYNVKPKFQQILQPILRFLYKRNITANQITISAIIFSFFIGLSFWFADKYPILFLALPIGLFIRMALNALDGMMARTYNQQSKLGEILNEIGDIIADCFIFIPLIKHEPSSLYLVVIFILLSIINEFAGVLGKTVCGERRYEGPMGKSDRALVVGTYGIISYYTIDITPVFNYAILTIIALLTVSTITRVRRSL